jgi:thiamine biosynthesis protein ThiI
MYEVIRAIMTNEPSPYQLYVIHYGELSLKGKNRPLFVKQLARNVEQALRGLGRDGECDIHILAGRILVIVPETISRSDVAERLSRVFGVSNFAPCLQAPHDMAAIKSVVSQALHGRQFGSFRIAARRAFKELPFGSREMNYILGAHVMDTHDTTVSLNHPELTVHVELIPRQTLVYLDKLPGAGGLPSGVSGRLITLLSGGLDSPVAAHRMMKRGCRVDFVHFHSYPFLDRTSQDKAQVLARLLTRYQYHGTLFLVPFGEIQQHIIGVAPPPDRVVLYRRCMLRIAETIARQRHAQALVTGESLGQVASQTLYNLQVIEAAATLPVLRPLIGMDKTEIIAQARAIGTYETSILPDQDCCTLFVPRHPSTRVQADRIAASEQRLDIPALIQMAMDAVQTVDIRFPEVSKKAPSSKAFLDV